MKEIRVAILGNVDSAKSTLVSTITYKILDNGRGSAREKVFKHKHEKEIELYLFQNDEINTKTNEVKMFTLKGKDKKITFFMSITEYKKPVLKTTYKINEGNEETFDKENKVLINFFPQPASPKEVRHSSTATPSTAPVHSMTTNTHGALAHIPSAIAEDANSLGGLPMRKWRKYTK